MLLEISGIILSRITRGWEGHLEHSGKEGSIGVLKFIGLLGIISLYLFIGETKNKILEKGVKLPEGGDGVFLLYLD